MRGVSLRGTRMNYMAVSGNNIKGCVCDVLYTVMCTPRRTALTEILQPYIALDTNEITEPLV